MTLAPCSKLRQAKSSMRGLELAFREGIGPWQLILGASLVIQEDLLGCVLIPLSPLRAGRKKPCRSSAPCGTSGPGSSCGKCSWITDAATEAGFSVESKGCDEWDLLDWKAVFAWLNQQLVDSVLHNSPLDSVSRHLWMLSDAFCVWDKEVCDRHHRQSVVGFHWTTGRPES